MTGLECLTPLLDGGAKVGEPRLLGFDSGDPFGKLLLALRQCSRTGRDRARQVLVEPLLLRHTTIVKRHSENVAVTSGAPKRRGPQEPRGTSGRPLRRRSRPPIPQWLSPSS